MRISNEIVVVGSCMIDFVGYAPRLPKQGETIHGTKFVTNFGGKGANQCVAAAKLGAKTTLVTRLGDDLWADKYIENLNNFNINTKYVLKTEHFSSGIAQINVSDEGDNQIVIIAGANTQLCPEDVENAKEAISGANIVVLQLETSIDVAIAALETAKHTTILNGAPAISSFNSKLLSLPTIFCVNESEASVFSSLSVTNLDEAKEAAKWLIAEGCNSVLLTLGEGGVIYVEKNNINDIIHVKCPKVNCVDSTGAGDAFIGSLAFILANYKGLTMREVVEKACLVASDSVTKPGTQISFPGPEILEKIGLFVD